MQKLREWHGVSPTFLLMNLHQAACQKFLSRFETCWLRIWIVATMVGVENQSEYHLLKFYVALIIFLLLFPWTCGFMHWKSVTWLPEGWFGANQNYMSVWSRGWCLPWAALYQLMVSVMEPGLTPENILSWDSPGLLSPTTSTGPPSSIPPRAWVCCTNVCCTNVS